MENVNNKENYTKIMNSNGDIEDKPIEQVKEKITIHTMPKRYMASIPASSQAKNTGVLILILGFLFLILALMLFYFLILKKDPQVEEISDNIFSQVASTTPVVKKDNAQKSPTTVTPQIDNVQQTDSSPASSTPVRKPIKHINSASSTALYQAATDSDRDGLSDLEELLLGSSPNSEDTDGDGYLDQSEVLHLYDPASQGDLLDSLNIEEYYNREYGFSIFVSSLWTVDSVSGNDSLIVSLGKDQYIQIISQKNYDKQSLDDWYKQTFDVDEVHDSQRFKKGNWQGVFNNDKLTIYLMHPSKKYIITLNYEIGNDNTLYYKNIFNMILQSISIIDEQ